MTCSANLYVLLPCVEGTGTISHGPYATIPKALDAAERIKKGWKRQKHHTPPNEPHIRIVKVVTEMYIGEGE